MRISRIERARQNDGINPVETWFKGFSRDTEKKAESFCEETGVSFSLSLTAKMLGVLSLSTNCKFNARCIRNMAIKGSICEHCFARGTVEQYDALSVNTRKNLDVLTYKVIPAEAWPTFNAGDLGHMIRIESFGDVQNVIQVLNYFNLALANPDCTVSAWTKNPDIYKMALDMGHKMPKNFILIQSSLFLGREQQPAFDFIEKVFTVYTDGSDNGINCAERKCRNCKRCYMHGREYVHELLK